MLLNAGEYHFWASVIFYNFEKSKNKLIPDIIQKNIVITQELQNCEVVNKMITLQLYNIGKPILETIDYCDKTL